MFLPVYEIQAEVQKELVREIDSGSMLAGKWAVIHVYVRLQQQNVQEKGYISHTHILILTFDVGDEDGTLVGEVEGLDVGCER